MLRTLRRHLVFPALLILGLFILGIQPASAASCSGWGGNMAFGTVDLLNTSTTDSSMTLTIGCNAQPGDQVIVCLGIGPNPGTSVYDPRYLNPSGFSGSDMAFNLYREAARTSIWGEVGAPAAYQPQRILIKYGSSDYYLSTTTTVFGRVKSAGQQGLKAGQYQSANGWPVATLKYKTYSGNPPGCNSGGMSSATFAIYNITAKVESDCRIDSVSTLDFGTVFQSLTQNVDSTATITVTCNGGSPWSGYYVLLGNGLYANGSQRRMQGPGGAKLNYNLYRDTARSQAWGNTNQTGVSGTGSGSPQSITVYGRVPPQSVQSVGQYTDTVVVTISY